MSLAPSWNLYADGTRLHAIHAMMKHDHRGFHPHAAGCLGSDRRPHKHPRKGTATRTRSCEPRRGVRTRRATPGRRRRRQSCGRGGLDPIHVGVLMPPEGRLSVTIARVVVTPGRAGNSMNFVNDVTVPTAKRNAR